MDQAQSKYRNMCSSHGRRCHHSKALFLLSMYFELGSRPSISTIPDMVLGSAWMGFRSMRRSPFPYSYPVPEKHPLISRSFPSRNATWISSILNRRSTLASSLAYKCMLSPPDHFSRTPSSASYSVVCNQGFHFPVGGLQEFLVSNAS